jgi:hypothetical protein
MNSFGTLFFPETTVFSDKRYPLLLFFTPLHFIQAMEPGPSPVVDPEAEIFLKGGLCQPHVPAPLGDNYEQFLWLTHDMREQKEHLVDQLRQKTIDSSSTLSAGEFLDFRHNIVSSLLHEYGVKHANIEMDLLLWQARLVLIIAEIVDSNEKNMTEQFFC